MKKNQYHDARRLCRDNGCCALNWLSNDHAKIMDSVMFQEPNDMLVERVESYQLMGWSIQLAKSLALEIAEKPLVH